MKIIIWLVWIFYFQGKHRLSKNMFTWIYCYAREVINNWYNGNNNSRGVFITCKNTYSNSAFKMFQELSSIFSKPRECLLFAMACSRRQWNSSETSGCMVTYEEVVGKWESIRTYPQRGDILELVAVYKGLDHGEGRVQRERSIPRTAHSVV